MGAVTMLIQKGRRRKRPCQLHCIWPRRERQRNLLRSGPLAGKLRRFSHRPWTGKLLCESALGMPDFYLASVKRRKEIRLISSGSEGNRLLARSDTCTIEMGN